MRWGRGSAPLTAALAVMMLVAGACAGGGSDTDAGASTVAAAQDEATGTTSSPGSSEEAGSEEPVSTEDTAPTTTAAEEPASSLVASSETTEVPAVCATTELPSGPTTVPVEVDVDADGLTDTAYMLQSDTGWQAVVEFGGGGATATAMSGTNDFDQPFVMGEADLDGDGFNELGISVGNGAYVGLIAFLRVRDCDIIQLAFEDSSPAIFASGASAAGGEALVCDGSGNLEVYFFSLLPGLEPGSPDAEYEGGFAPYKIEGDTVVAYPGDGASLSAADVDALELLDCLGLDLIL